MSENVNKALAYTLREDARYRFDYLPLYENKDIFQSIALYQVGDLCAKSGFCMGQHVQHYHEVCYIASGAGKFHINGTWYPVRQGDLIITRIGDTHDIITDDQDPLRIYYFEFYLRPAVKETAPYCDIHSLFENTSVHNRICHAQDVIPSVFRGIFGEMMQQEHFYGNIIESYSLQLLISVYRSYAKELLTPDTSFTSKNNLAHEVIRYLDANIESITNLYSLTDVFKYSYSHLAHVFKEQIGMSLYQYYDKKRFDCAQELLRTTNARISEIAEKLSYQSVNAFSKAFRKRFGISPSEYITTYQSSASYNPQFEQGKKMLLDSLNDTESHMQGTIFFCGGSCLRSVSAIVEEEEIISEQTSRHAGYVLPDIDDPIYM